MLLLHPARPASARSAVILAVSALVLGVCAARAATTPEVLVGRPVRAAGSAVVHFDELARWEAAHPHGGVVRPRMNEMNEERETDEEPGAEGVPPSTESAPPPFVPFVASPSPTLTYIGLDDIPMVDSSYIVIPPDVGGAVGLTKVLQGLNNNYRTMNKADGAVLSTVGTATFWAGTGAGLNTLSDPRTIYDPYNDRWLTCMIADFGTSSSSIVLGISQTSDPGGAWSLYRVIVFESNTVQSADYPILGFNKNWVVVTVNMYTSAGAFSRGKALIVNYPNLRAGTFTPFTVTRSSGTGFCASPCVTYSPTSDTLYVPTHLSSSGAMYQVDKIIGTTTPTYLVGTSQLRPGGGWVAASGNALPQSAPSSGTSSCGATPCLIEATDAQIRSSPVFRAGAIYYAQTVGLPAGTMTHTGIQWTKLTTPSGAFADGGRLEDPTATATNGGKWYAFSHIATNAVGDFVLGFTQFSSAQHPAAGYAAHLAGDGAGTIRDAFLYHAGEDYYHKTFGSGRNRWGDFSTVQVDPSDDRGVWILQEYAKPRTSTDDGNTGSNGSRWGTWWALVGAPTFTITASAGPNGSIAPSGAVVVNSGASQGFTITPNAGSHVADVLVDGASVGAVTAYTFTNVTANHTIAASFAIDTHTITASAGTGGSIAPNGAVVVSAGADQGFTITPDASYHVLDVLVDGASVGAVTAYTFTNVQADHTIDASFSIDTYTITATAGAGGTIAPSGAVSVNAGADQSFTITPDPGQHVVDVLVDGGSVGAVTAYTFTSVAASHTIDASFGIDTHTITATAGANGVIAPSGAVSVSSGADQAFTITPDAGYHVLDVLVDAASVGAVTDYTFTNVTADHAIDASFEADVTAIGDLKLPVPTRLAIAAALPNPFTRRIDFLIGTPAAADVSVTIWDGGGRLVTAIASQRRLTAGYTAFTWNGENALGRQAAGGVYVVRVDAGGARSTRSIVKLR